MKMQVNNIIRVPVSSNKEFFKYWLMFIAPFHHLTNREMDVAVALLERRYELGKVISDEDLLDKVALNEDSKQKVRKELSMTSPHFQIIMGKLKKAKFILDGKINTKFIPKRLTDKDQAFQLLLYFDFSGSNR